MTRNARKPSPPKGYGHELIRLEQPRDELCQDVAHIMRRAMVFNGGRTKPVQPDERISHICQWRYKRKGAEAIVRRWVCRGCAVAWARKHIWKAGQRKAMVPDLELKGAG